VRLFNTIPTTIVALVMLAAGIDMRASDRFLRADLTIEAPVADVWNAWTTEAGVTSFFAPGTKIEPRVDGLYEIYFDPTQPPGQRGAEGMRKAIPTLAPVSPTLRRALDAAPTASTSRMPPA
jgi:hypothetical protein